MSLISFWLTVLACGAKNTLVNDELSLVFSGMNFVNSTFIQLADKSWSPISFYWFSMQCFVWHFKVGSSLTQRPPCKMNVTVVTRCDHIRWVQLAAKRRKQSIPTFLCNFAKLLLAKKQESAQADNERVRNSSSRIMLRQQQSCLMFVCLSLFEIGFGQSRHY